MRRDKGLSGDADRLPQLTWLLFLKFLDDMDAIAETEAELEGRVHHPAVVAPYRWRDWAAPPDGITGDALLHFINDEYFVAKGPSGEETRIVGLLSYLRALQGARSGDRAEVVARVFTEATSRMRSGYLLRELINKVNEIDFRISEQVHTLSAIYESMLKEMRDAAGDAGEFYTPRPVVRMMVELVDPRLGETVLDPACGTGGFLVESFRHLAAQVDTPEQRRVLQGLTATGQPGGKPSVLGG